MITAIQILEREHRAREVRLHNLDIELQELETQMVRLKRERDMINDELMSQDNAIASLKAND